MKKFFSVLILSLILTSTSSAGVKKGKGDVILDKYSLENFITYIRGKVNQYPLGFILSSDGSWSTYWFCPDIGGCRSVNFEPTIRECEDETGADCGLFARRYTILWKNGINPGKGKESRIKKKWSDEEIIAKLTELGFLGDDNSSITKKDNKTEVDLPIHKIRWSKGDRKKDWIDMMTGGSEKNKTWADAISTKSSYWTYGWNATNDSALSSAKKSTKNCEDYRKKKLSKYSKHDICIVYFLNGIPTSKEEKIKFANKFYGKKRASLAFENNPSLLEKSEQNITKKIVKKYSESGERSIALSWDGYESLIAGTVEFDEADYKGTLKIPLPNNDGTCDGSYSLQEGGKGTWQIACTNDMGAAGTLKWTETGGVTGKGRDHNDKKVKFTVSKKS